MINDLYYFNNGRYALGGCINGEVDNLIITSNGEADIYVISIRNDKSVALSERYALVVQCDDGSEKNLKKYSAKDLRVKDHILMNDGTFYQIDSIEKRKGTDITVPKKMFNLNGFVVSNKTEKREIWTSKNKQESTRPANSEAKNKSQKK